MIKSGTDFREFSLVQIGLNEKKVQIEKIEKYIVDSSIKEKPEVKSLINTYIGKKKFFL